MQIKGILKGGTRLHRCGKEGKKKREKRAKSLSFEGQGRH